MCIMCECECKQLAENEKIKLHREFACTRAMLVSLVQPHAIR